MVVLVVVAGFSTNINYDIFPSVLYSNMIMGKTHYKENENQAKAKANFFIFKIASNYVLCNCNEYYPTCKIFLPVTVKVSSSFQALLPQYSQPVCGRLPRTKVLLDWIRAELDWTSPDMTHLDRES